MNKQEKTFIQHLVFLTQEGQIDWWVGRAPGIYETIYNKAVVTLEKMQSTSSHSSVSSTQWVLSVRNREWSMSVKNWNNDQTNEEYLVMQHLYATIVEMLSGAYKVAALQSTNTNQKVLGSREQTEERGQLLMELMRE